MKQGYDQESRVLHIHDGGLQEYGPYASAYVASMLAKECREGGHLRLDIRDFFVGRKGDRASVDWALAQRILSELGLQFDKKRYSVTDFKYEQHQHYPDSFKGQEFRAYHGTFAEQGFNFTLEEGPLFGS